MVTVIVKKALLDTTQAQSITPLVMDYRLHAGAIEPGAVLSE